MRFFPPSIEENQRKDAPVRIAVLVLAVLMAPVVAWYSDWRLGAAIIAAYAALGYGVWRVAQEP